MADNHTLPAVGEVVRSTERTDNAKIQHVLLANFKSADNSSTSALTGSATFTGTWEEAPADGVTVSCLADAAGTLYFDFSNDGGTTNTTFPSAGFVVAANIHEYHRAAVNGRHFRVRLVNGSSAQSTLNLTTYYGPHTHPAAPLNQTLGADADAMVVRSPPQLIDAALGRLGGVSQDTKFGRVKSIDAADAAVDIWALADDTASPRSNTKTFPTTAATIYLTSSSTSDTAVDITVEYIDANGAAATAADVRLTGQTPVSIGATGLDVNRIRNTGSTASVGIIYASNTNDFTAGAPNDVTDILAVAPAGYEQSQLSHFTVPSGKKLIMNELLLMISRASGAAGSADVTLRIKESGGVSRVRREFFPTTSVPIDKGVMGLTVSAGGQIVWRMDDVSDTDTSASVVWSYYLVDV